jgi:hypothetical protein
VIDRAQCTSSPTRAIKTKKTQKGKQVSGKAQEAKEKCPKKAKPPQDGGKSKRHGAIQP